MTCRPPPCTIHGGPLPTEAATAVPNGGWADAAAESDAVGCRLRDLLLRFPCSALDGVRWSSLCKAYGDRFPGEGCLGGALQAATSQARRVWLVDLAEEESSGNGLPQGDGRSSDVRIRLRDDAALSPGRDGQLACWPLLVQRLGQIVGTHGSPQHAHALEVPHEDGSAEDGPLLGEPGGEVVGVLLAQLKPLLRRFWDPSFEERAVGFFNENGNYVNVKKMKHLMTELIKWRARRRVLARTQGGHASAVDAALEVPIVLAVSQRHNDMVLCCPKPPGGLPLGGVGPLESLKDSGLTVITGMPSRSETSSAGDRARRSIFSTAGGTPAGHQLRACAPVFVSAQLVPAQCGAADATASLASAASTRQPDATQRIEDLENDCRRLRIENAELKKRLRFDSDFLHKEIRHLRIENAELKKRCFFSSHHLASESSGPEAMPHLPLQPVWVSNAGAVLTPVVAASPTNGPSLATPCATPAEVAVPGSGQETPGQQNQDSCTPSLQGSLTPIPHGYCYAVQWPQGIVGSPGQHPWPAGALGPFVAATAMQRMTGGGTAAMSPFSDASQAERLLPNNLFGSEAPSSHSASDFALSPPTTRAKGPHAHAQFQGRDDRWVCIPSGIVEQQKAQFERPGGAFDFGGEARLLREAEAAAEAQQSGTTGEGEGSSGTPHTWPECESAIVAPSSTAGSHGTDDDHVAVID